MSLYQNQLQEDEYFMQLVLELAARGSCTVSPNPMVGAVIVYNGQIIGQGWHERCGEAHAEVKAIDSVTDQTLLAESTIYVNLEPCSHWGRTPPCCDLIIAKGFKRVVVGCVDPNEKVSGQGIARIRASGIEVVTGVLQQASYELNRRFFTTHTVKRPYIILKWAQTSDGYIDIVRPATIAPKWMTGPDCRRLVHQWRAEEDAVMVGRRTVEKDNPALTVRDFEGRNPLRITLDRELVLGTEQAIFDDQAPTLLFTTIDNVEPGRHKFESNRLTEVDSLDYSSPILPQILNALYCRGVQSLFVEGGLELLQTFIDSALWDEARIFTAPVTIDELYADIDQVVGIAAPVILPTCTGNSRQIMIGEISLNYIYKNSQQS